MREKEITITQVENGWIVAVYPLMGQREKYVTTHREKVIEIVRRELDKAI